MFRIFFPPAGLASADRKLLLLLAAAFFLAQYDMSVLSLALPDLQASFNISEQDLGKVIGAARLGALPAIFLALLADRIGRRRLLMVTLLGLSIATGATGFARTTEEFIAIQFCARAFRHGRGNYCGYLCARNVARAASRVGCGLFGGNGWNGFGRRVATLRTGGLFTGRLAGTLRYCGRFDSLYRLAAPPVT